MTTRSRRLAALAAGPILVAAAALGSVAVAGPEDRLAHVARPGAEAGWTLTTIDELDASFNPGHGAETERRSERSESTVELVTIDLAADEEGRLGRDLRLEKLSVRRERDRKVVTDIVLWPEGVRMRGIDLPPDPALRKGLAGLFAEPRARVRHGAAAPEVEAVAVGGGGDDVDDVDLISIARALALTVPAFPDGPVKSGATWTARRTIALGDEDTVPLELTYELEDLADGLATIGVSCHHDDPARPLKAASGRSVGTQKLTVEIDGSLRFETRRGTLRDAWLTITRRSSDRPVGTPGEGYAEATRSVSKIKLHPRRR